MITTRNFHHWLMLMINYYLKNHREGEIRRQPPTPRPQDYYRGFDNITDSDGPVFFHPLPHGHTFVVNSRLMQMLTATGLFSVCKSCLGRPNLNMDVIGLRVFSISLKEEAAIWFTELLYNSIYTCNQLRDVFLARYYPVSKNLNHKDRVNKFVALPGESISISWDRFISFLRNVPNHRIDDESLKEYFSQG